MNHQIFSIQQIKDMARNAARDEQLSSTCPFAPGTSHYDWWMTEFHRMQMEMRSEVEQ